MTLDVPIPDEVAQRISPMLSRHEGPIFVFDARDRLRWFNGDFARRFGLDLDALGRSWADLMRHCHRNRRGALIETTDLEHWLASAASRRAKQPFRQFEADLCDGSWILISETLDDDGWMLCIGQDISDLGRKHRELRVARDLALRASQADPLTGLANRSAVLERLAAMLASRRKRTCVALLDLDHFKTINDRHGHAAGDEVLRRFAEVLQAGLRRVDACGRIGGEEFMVILRDLDLDAAATAVDRLLADVRAARPLRDDPEFGYTASAGLVEAIDGERPEDVMRRADKALYCAKRGGRDRCRIGEP